MKGFLDKEEQLELAATERFRVENDRENRD